MQIPPHAISALTFFCPRRAPHVADPEATAARVKSGKHPVKLEGDHYMFQEEEYKGCGIHRDVVERDKTLQDPNEDRIEVEYNDNMAA